MKKRIDPLKILFLNKNWIQNTWQKKLASNLPEATNCFSNICAYKIFSDRFFLRRKLKRNNSMKIIILYGIEKLNVHHIFLCSSKLKWVNSSWNLWATCNFRIIFWWKRNSMCRSVLQWNEALSICKHFDIYYRWICERCSFVLRLNLEWMNPNNNRSWISQQIGVSFFPIYK